MSGTLAAAVSEQPTTPPVIGRPRSASVALGSGSGLGALAVWLVGLSGQSMPPEVGAAIGGVVAAAAIFIAHRGIVGAAKTLLFGDH
jgi:hypothetical protein